MPSAPSSATIFSTVSISGAWRQKDLGTAKRMYRWKRWTNNAVGAKAWSIVGSNDQTTWYLVDRASNKNTNNTTVEVTVNSSYSQYSYRYYRWIDEAMTAATPYVLNHYFGWYDELGNFLTTDQSFTSSSGRGDVTSGGSSSTVFNVNFNAYNWQQSDNYNSNGVYNGSTTTVAFDPTLPLFIQPGAPTSLVVTDLKNNPTDGANQSVSVSFTPGADGGNPITNYLYSIDNGATFKYCDPIVTSSPIIISGLSIAQTYNIILRSINSVAVGMASSSVAYTQLGWPEAPTSLVATDAGNQSVSISFTPGASEHSPITYYLYSIDNGVSYTYCDPSVLSSPIIIPGLSMGKTYNIRIRALNYLAIGTQSSSVAYTLPAGRPDVPKSVALLKGPYVGQSTVSFTPGWNGGSPITNYEYSTNNGLSYAACSPAVTSSPIIISGLLAGQSYITKIRAVNSLGVSIWSPSLSHIQGYDTAQTPFVPPTSLVVTDAGNQSVSVSFIPGVDGGSPITNYQYSIDNGTTFISCSPAVITSPVVISGLTNGQTYNIKIRAVNIVGLGTWGSAPAYTQLGSPEAPTSLVATDAGNQSVSVAFTPGLNGGSAITNYQYSIDNGTTYTSCNPVNVISPIVIVGLTNGQSYSIKLRAVNSVGTGIASSSVVYIVPMRNYVNTGAQFSKSGIIVSYIDDIGATATQNVTFANKTLSMDSGLNVSAGNAYLAGAAQIHGAAQLDSSLDVTGSGRFRNALIVDGTFNMGGALNVAGAASMGSTLAVTGASNLNNTLAVAGAASLNSSLAVAGASNLNNTLSVTGAASMNNTLAVAGAASMASTVDVTGTARLRNTLLVDGAATMGSSLAVTGASNLNGVLSVAGASNLNNTLAVSGAASMNNTLAVAGVVSLNSSLAVTGASNLNNTLAVAGAASLGSSLAVAGATTLTGALDVKAASHLENTLLVDGAASLGAALTVTGATTLNNGMTVNGTSTHNGALVVSGATSVGGALAATGAATLNSSLNAKGASRLEDVLVVDGAASLASSLAVAGNSALAGSLAVTGASTLTGALNVKAATHLENTLLVGGSASLGSSLTVTGASALNNTLAVAGAASLASTLAVTGAATLASSLAVAGAANVVGAMDVTGASRLRNSAQIDGAASFGSTLAVTGAANLSNSLAVAGATSMASTLDVTGASRLRNNVVVDGAASLNNSLAVTGAASMTSTLAVTGAANLNNTLAVTGAASLNNSLAVAGAASMASTLAVTGAANLNNSLAVAGAANLNNTLAVSGAASLNSSLAVTGAASMSNTLAVTGAATFQNNVTVNGNLTVLGSQTAIDTTSLQVKDNAILLADGNVADVLATGIQLQYKPSGSAAVKYAGVKRQPTTGEFVFFKDSAKTIDDPTVGAASSASTFPIIYPNTGENAKKLIGDPDGQPWYFGGGGQYDSAPNLQAAIEYVQSVAPNALCAQWSGSPTSGGGRINWYVSTNNGALQIASGSSWVVIQFAAGVPGEQIPSSTPSDIYATVMADSFNSASDARLKKNVVPLEGALDKIDAIRGVQYHWIDGEQSESRQVGVIAQEIQSVYPELVMEGSNGFLSVDYPKLTAVLIESIKELKAMAMALMNK